MRFLHDKGEEGSETTWKDLHMDRVLAAAFLSPTHQELS